MASLLFLFYSGPALAAPPGFNCPAWFQKIFVQSIPEPNAAVAVDSFTTHSRMHPNGKLAFSPERMAIHEQVMKPFREEAQLVARTLTENNGGLPVLIMTRGNSGSGKSYSIKNADHPLLESLGLKSLLNSHEEGIINPDSIKAALQIDVEKNMLSSQQVHEVCPSKIS